MRTIDLNKSKRINRVSYLTEISIGLAYIFGSLLFVIGSVLFLPAYYDDNAEAAVECFIWGSACFLLATMVTSLVHLVLIIKRHFIPRVEKGIIAEDGSGNSKLSNPIIAANTIRSHI